jgi:hypothetical protein
MKAKDFIVVKRPTRRSVCHLPYWRKSVETRYQRVMQCGRDCHAPLSTRPRL